MLVCPKSTHRANCLAQMPFAAPPWRPFPQWETSCGSQAQLFERLEGMHCPTQQGFFLCVHLNVHASVCPWIAHSCVCLCLCACVSACLRGWVAVT